ncbi:MULTISPECIES: TIGR02678 family protein [unclassified Rhodococcus (in: high G+C Gram-positive bacteria)]|uniref:TIGR02678 family protein n=1 Tax=unclassified Rhodococcus (in: high G+C Gram-positive bacteria) TaxID=192944 RepID=UPI00233EA16B|nr:MULTISPECIES: TIGR02678 family protein [unclassified Rhodococcus (in: high G+C Gram-positive bacteria)]MDC3728459.1 TIGR02678 family protein [Rhodococcus sp. Rp3]WSE24238.1 TIGR02678 family protein [Rhodococcus sp. PD04]
MSTSYASAVSGDVSGRRDAARALLQQPIVTAASDRETFDLVRRHAPALKSMFADRLGYRLVVEPTFARLTKAPLGSTSPHRALRHADGTEFGATTYACLALVCAALIEPGTGARVSVDDLLEQVRADAREIGIVFGDPVSEERNFAAALRVLEEWGVITESGHVDEATGDGPHLDVHRDLLPHLLDIPLHGMPGPAAALARHEHEPAARRLYRRLVEDPFVARDALDDESTTILARDRHELARMLEDDFGLVLEVRAEGALAYDPAGVLTDEAFPGSGTLKHACLLLLAELTERFGDSAAATLHVDVHTLDSVLADLAAARSRTWKSIYVRDLALLRRDVVALLVRLGLARPHENGLELTAPSARYRPVPAESTCR